MSDPNFVKELAKRSTQYTITKEEYASLIKSKAKLEMLEASGVDCWEWYDDSLNPEGEKSYSDLCEQIDRDILGEG